MRVVTSKTWIDSNGHELLRIMGSLAQVDAATLNADHLEELADACREAAKELRAKVVPATSRFPVTLNGGAA